MFARARFFGMLALVTTGACNARPSPPSAASVVPPSVGTTTDPELHEDLVKRTWEARALLGGDAQTEVVADVFLVAGAAEYDEFASGVSLTRRAIEAYLNARFDHRPTHAITVLLFATAAPYEEFCSEHEGHACITPYGYFDPDHRRMVMNAGLGLGTLTHELVHPMVDADFPGAPTRIDEGIASLYEAPVIPAPGVIHGRKNWRWPGLRSALLAKNDDAAIDRLFGMSDDDFRDEKEGLHYALARYFCQWLDDHDRLWPFYRRWRDDRANDPTGEKAFTAIAGKSPAAANAEFRQWVLALE